MHTYHGDVVIIGGGLAGIATALELLDTGQTVTVLDREDASNLGGLAKESFGGIFVVGSGEQRRAAASSGEQRRAAASSGEQRRAGITDTPDLAFRDWCAFAEFGRDDRWPRQWAEAYSHRCNPDVYWWLKARGIGFVPMPHWVERGQFTPGNSVPRFHIVWGTGRELVLQLVRRLQHHANASKLTMLFGHRVDALIWGYRRASGEERIQGLRLPDRRRHTVRRTGHRQLWRGGAGESDSHRHQPNRIQQKLSGEIGN